MKACEKSTIVVPCFIFEPRQMPDGEDYNPNAFQFMIKSLKELIESMERRDARLYLFYGDYIDTVRKILVEENIDAVFVNSGYTPDMKLKDNKTADICDRNNIAFFQIHDNILQPPELVLKDDGKPYSVFTYFHNKAEALHVRNPTLFYHRNFHNKTIPLSNQKFIDNLDYKLNAGVHIKGGRKEAISLFDNLRTLRSYEKDKDIPSLNATSNLSAHLSFGTISIREAYRAGKESVFIKAPFLRQLYWRDFFTYVGYFFPYVFDGAFHEKFNNMKWGNNEEWFDTWKFGMTGYPIVDAGMRQLRKTGFINNRIRMITASFLVKDLHIDWRWGEKHFANMLVDHDQSLNNGNWQWSASTGCDAQPYFRIFNPWLQQTRYDPDCVYIKKWIPELENVDNLIIHSLYESGKNLRIDYPQPIVDHDVQSVKIKEEFKRITDAERQSRKLPRGRL